jgi:GNAT superfamily N-acetyltransferase
MISRLQLADLKSILHVVNKAAEAYKGVIPMDRWKQPYMSAEELREEIEGGVEFYGWIEDNLLVAVMGIQPVNGVTLVRHAYVLPNYQREGIGDRLLRNLLSLARTSEVLVGTWEATHWAISFYEKHGFKLISKKEKDRLLWKYWKIPERQVETSVVLKLKRQN